MIYYFNKIWAKLPSWLVQSVILVHLRPNIYYYIKLWSILTVLKLYCIFKFQFYPLQFLFFIKKLLVFRIEISSTSNLITHLPTVHLSLLLKKNLKLYICTIGTHHLYSVFEYYHMQFCILCHVQYFYFLYVISINGVVRIVYTYFTYIFSKQAIVLKGKINNRSGKSWSQIRKLMPPY